MDILCEMDFLNKGISNIESGRRGSGIYEYITCLIHKLLSNTMTVQHSNLSVGLYLLVIIKITAV